MLQAALGGYKNVSTSTTALDDAPVYHEPGFTIVSPLEVDVPESDQIYVLLRNRTDALGIVFETMAVADYNVSVKDATTGEDVPGFLDTNVEGQTVYNAVWDTDISMFQPVILVINNSLDVFSPVERVRVLDVFISHKTEPEKNIVFRLTGDDSGKFVHYINVSVDEIGNRFSFSSFGREIVTSVSSPSSTYVLISPFAYLNEVNALDNPDFSYPLESVFYKRQKTFNEEEFDFSIESTSHAFIEEGVSLINVPGYKKTAVLFIDRFVYNEMLSITDNTYLDIRIHGRLSRITDLFRVNLVR